MVMKSARLKSRTILLLLVEAMLLFGGMVIAVSFWMGAVDAEVALISLPLALSLMVAWRLSIHWILGHPELGERILIVGSGPFAVEIAKETLQRKDAGFRVVGFVDNDPALVGKSLINPKVIGLASELASLVKSESID